MKERGAVLTAAVLVTARPTSPEEGSASMAPSSILTFASPPSPTLCIFIPKGEMP